MAKGGTKILFGLFFFVVLVAGLAGGGAWYLTEHRVEGYRATALLRLDPGLEQPVDPADGISDVATHVFGVSTAPLPAPDYAVIFHSDGVAKLLQEKLAGHGENPGMTLEDVKKAMQVETAVALQTTTGVWYKQFVQLHFTAPSPALAQAGAQEWAALCVARENERAEGDEKVQRDALQAEMDTASVALGELRNQQSELRKTASLPALEQAVDSTGEAVADLRQAVRQAQAAAARGEASLKALKAYVSKAPPAVVLELSMAEATAESETAGALAESAFLSGQLAEAEAAAQAATTAWADAVRQHEEIEAKIAALEPQVAHLEQQYARIQHAGPRVRLASDAVAPESPVGPHRYVLVAGAAILGAIAGMVVYFGLLTLRVYARELDRT